MTFRDPTTFIPGPLPQLKCYFMTVGIKTNIIQKDLECNITHDYYVCFFILISKVLKLKYFQFGFQTVPSIQGNKERLKKEVDLPDW